MLQKKRTDHSFVPNVGEFKRFCGAGDWTIQGFATSISVNQGQTVSFKINTNATSCKLDLYRLGYYGGMGRA